jgi:predicted Rossmann fold flavoprotein
MTACRQIQGEEDDPERPGEAKASDSPRFEITTPRRRLRTDSLLITTGGQSYPGSGTTGDGYQWARQLGHTITPLRPALTPLLTEATWVRELQGITLPDVQVEIVPSDVADSLPPESKAYRRARLAERRGSLLFTHFGLSGPVALDVSRVVSGHPEPQTLRMRVDLLPDLPEEELIGQLQQEKSTTGRRSVVAWLADLVPRRVAEALLTSCDTAADRRLAELTKGERTSLIRALKRCDIPMSGTRGYKKAEVTAGGVALDEVDSRTMQSKLVPGLYFAGEILDLDGPIGGYNFQAAFSTGWLAGSHL